jgi:hypothetical protein
VVETGAKVATLRLADGSVVSGRSNSALAKGDEATLAVKPVDVTVEPATSERTGSIPARVQAAMFVGPTVELDLVVAGRDVRVPVPRRSAEFGGDVVRLYVDPEHATILKGHPDPATTPDRSAGQ